MSDQQDASFLARYWPIVLGLGLVLVWALWPRGASETEIARARSESADAPTHVGEATLPARAADPAEAAQSPLAPAPVAPAVAPRAPAPAGHQHSPQVSAYQEPPYELPIVGAAPDAPHDQAMHPHPVTEEHVRIQKINGLIQNLNDAMSNRDVKAMRALVAEFKTLDPGDEDNFQLGYGVVADCIEAPGRASSAAARNFYDTYRASPLRRFVRRLCFEAGS